MTAEMKNITRLGKSRQGKEGKKNHLKKQLRDFPGSPVVKTSPSSAGGAGLIPGRGAKIPHASQPKNQNIKQNKFNKDFKNGPHQKKILKKESN